MRSLGACCKVVMSDSHDNIIYRLHTRGGPSAILRYNKMLSPNPKNGHRCEINCRSCDTVKSKV